MLWLRNKLVRIEEGEIMLLDVLPKVRDEVDAFPYENHSSSVMPEDFEEPAYILYDSSGLSEAQLLVGESSMLLLARMDGRHSLLDLREEYERETGLEVYNEDIENMLRELDAARFLENEHFRDLYNNLLNEFMVSKVRPSACAGSIYSEDAEVLRDELDILMREAPRFEVEGRIGNVLRRAPRGVIAPHMDFSRAAKCYGQVYRKLRDQYNRPEVVIILGTAHGSMRHRFAVCDKDFAVTGGVVRCHNAATAQILSETAAVADFREDIFMHRSEHSIELQAVWLDYIWPGIEIVPVLIGDMTEYIHEPDKVTQDEEIWSMVSAIRGVMDSCRVMLLASADLSHIGRRFGDERDIDIGFISETEVADRNYLREVVAGKGDQALRSLAAHGDRYHLCGTGCIYVLGALLPNVSGQLLGYYQAVSEELEQAVGCAGVIFE